MRVLAIDPGCEKSAILGWDGTILRDPEIKINADVLERVISSNLAGYDLAAIEMVACYGMPVGKEVFETCVFIGKLLYALELSGVQTQLIYRKDVKMHHCGSMRAKDANIRQALIDKYGAPGTKKTPGKTYGLKADLWSAFAIATYVFETRPQAI